MRTTIRSLKLTLTLLALMCTMHLAQAFYMAEAGRWINRDPLGEAGAQNLYGFVANCPVNIVDALGLQASAGVPKTPALFPPAPPPKPGTPGHPGGGQCPNNPPASNGCGPAGWAGKLVPNMPFWMISFTPACNAHDICYGTCGNQKSKCDENFRGDMYAACYLKWGESKVVLYTPVIHIPSADEILLKKCYALADAYYLAVSNAGNSAYAAAQQQGCKCLCPSKK